MKKLRANFFRENGGTNAVVKFSVAANWFEVWLSVQYISKSWYSRVVGIPGF
jgi:hypothetical protein